MKANKDLGQHFLSDHNIAQDIVNAALIQSDDVVWEIGPGQGFLTRALVPTQAKVIAFELDKRMQCILSSEFGDSITLVMKDILSVDWDAELTHIPKLKIVANIPYQITSPLLYKIEANASHMERIVLMVQKEVAQRLTASAATKHYGSMTIRIARLFDTSILFEVGKEKFDPIPKVDSAVILMTPRKNPTPVLDTILFYRLVQYAFSHRRKTLRNNLKPLYEVSKLEQIEERSGIDLSRRGETLSETEFILLSDSISML